MKLVFTFLTFLVAVTLTHVQSQGQVGQEQSPKQVTPKQAMDYFAGTWRGTGIQGNYEYTGRVSAEWDLHHNIMSHRFEFFGTGFANTLLLIQMKDPQQAKIVEHQYASWGHYRRGEYEVVPHGDWFQLVGVCEETGANGIKKFVNLITAHDENHYSFAGVPQQGSAGVPFLENYTRQGFAAREDKSSRTDECLRKAIEYIKLKPNANHSELLTLKLALGRFLIDQDKYVDAVEMLEEMLAQQTELLSPENTDADETINAIAGLCKNVAYGCCMDADTTAEELSTVLKAARKASELTPHDQRIWLQAFAHYRLGDDEAAQLAIRTSISAEPVWEAVLLLAAMIENKAGNAELARAIYMVGAELGAKGKSAEFDKWRAMAEQAIGLPPNYAALDKDARLAAYETAIKAYPRFAEAYRMRGRFYGGLGQWDKALDDYRQAAEYLPNVIRYREGEAAIVLYQGTPEEQNAICQKLFQEWADSDMPSPRMDTVLMCSLFPAANVDRQRITEIADEVMASLPTRAFLTVCKGMSLYRQKRYEDVVKTISTEGSVNPKDLILGQIFLAMAHQQLGHPNKARQILKQAQAISEQQVSAPSGTPLQYQDRPIVWCMIQSAFREAEQLIGRAEDSRLNEAATR